MLQPTVKLEIESEVGRLGAVVVHTPGREHDLMLPENIVQTMGGEANPDYLLFDDLVQLEKAQEEHRILVDVLTAAVDDERRVFQFAHLLMEAISSDLDLSQERRSEVVASRGALFHSAVQQDRALYPSSDINPYGAESLLRGMDARRAVRTLIESRDILFRDQMPPASVFAWPTPNLLFTRDLAAVVKDTALVSNAKEPARKRETLMTGPLFDHNPRIREESKNRVVRVASAEDGDSVTLEGGDVMVADKRTVIVGTGARTNAAAFERLLPVLFDRSFDHVLRVEMPSARSSMHFDTIFTFTSHDECILYAPLVLGGQGADSIRVRVYSPAALKPAYETENIVGVLNRLRKGKKELSVIRCAGGRSLHEDREQWSDAVNTFALAPGKIVAYDRNPFTLRELNQHGYRILRPAEFLQNARYILDSQEKVCIAIPGAELSRGRGGPRCMTMPLTRFGP